MRLSGRILSGILLFAGCPAPCFAGGTGGAAPFNFIFLDADARPAALGGAYAALARNANALLYNPAGLGFIESHQITLMHNQHFQNISQEYGAFAYKIGHDAEKERRYYRIYRGANGVSHGWGIMVNTLSFGKIRRTTLSNPDGSGLDEFGIRDWLLAVGYGREITKGFGLGFSGKFLQETIDGREVQSPALDLGLLYKLPQAPLSLGLSVQNLGTRIRFNLDREELPLLVRFGAAWHWLKNGVLVADINQPRKGELTIHTGAEYTAFGTISLRMGLNGRNEAGNGVTMGMGILMPGTSLDYAFISFGDLGMSHRFSLSLHW